LLADVEEVGSQILVSDLEVGDDRWTATYQRGT